MQLTWSAPNRRLTFLDSLGLAGLSGLLVARFIPVARLPFWGCWFRAHTGWPCPGCGLTRVADRLAHGNVAGAWQANPLGTAAALFMVGAALFMLVHLVFGTPVPGLELSEREQVWSRRAAWAVIAGNYAWVLLDARVLGGWR